MKGLLFLVFVMSTTAFASTTPAYNAEKLSFLQQNRIGTVWNCKKGWGEEAVVMFKVNSTGARRISGDTVIAVQDPQICDALKVVCPYVGGAHPHNSGRKFHYWSTLGRYEDSIEFMSENGGMKVISFGNHNFNWYFNAGECILH